MNILIAEDDQDVTDLYRIAFESRGHNVTITYDGRECLKTYEDAFVLMRQANEKPLVSAPFDVVVLDYKMQKLDGLCVAKKIINLNSNQRIILASAFVVEAFEESILQLQRVIEMIQKPFEPILLAQLVEDTSVAKGLRNINEKLTMQALGQGRWHGQLVGELLDTLKKVQGIGF